MLGVMEKQPGDLIDFDIDFSRWLTETDIVTTAVAVVAPAYDAVTNPSGVQITAVQISNPDVKVWCSGGVDGKTYKVTLTASTSEGRIKEVDFQIRVKDC
jgi:hypothetical protein